MSASPAKFNEKRELIRMKINTPIGLRPENTATLSQAVCKQISGTGMMVATGTDYAIGTRVEVSLTGKDPFKASAEVVRRTADENGFLIGLKLLEIDE